MCAFSRRFCDASRALSCDSTRASAAPSRSSTATATCARALRRQASAADGASVLKQSSASSASAFNASASVKRAARRCVSRSAGKVTGFLPSARTKSATDANRPASDTKRARGGGAGAGMTVTVCVLVSLFCSPRFTGQTSHRARRARVSRATSSLPRNAKSFSLAASLDASSFASLFSARAIVGSISKHETKLTATSRRNPSSVSKASASASGSINRSAARALRAFAPPDPPDPCASVPSKLFASSRTLLGIDTRDSRKARCNVVSKKDVAD